MKRKKGILGLLLAIAMIVNSWTLFAYADISKGSIKITNAEIGTTYKIYKVFDATYNSYYDKDGKLVESYSYYTDNAAMIALIEADMEKGSDYGKKDASGAYLDVCPFVFDGGPTIVDGKTVRYVKHRKPEDIIPGRGWLTRHLTAWAADTAKFPTAQHTVTNTDPINEYTFENLEYGYYLLRSGSDPLDTVLTVVNDTTANNKNPNTPTNLVKQAHLTSKDVYVGQEIDYEVKFLAKNIVTTSGSATELITNYKLVDTAESGLKFKEIKSVQYFDASDTSCTTPLKTFASPSEYTSSYKDGVLTVNIPWANVVDIEGGKKDGTSKYPTPVIVRVLYTSEVTKDITKTQKATNMAVVNYDYIENGVIKTTTVPPSSPSETVYSSGISVRKLNDKSQLLSGATFILARDNGAGGKEYYKWEENPTGGKKSLQWVATDSEATVMEADNSYDTMEFKGLASGTYYLKEVSAPSGYVRVDGWFTIHLTFDESREDFKFKGTATNPSGSSIDCENSEGHEYITVVIVNGISKALPSTGGSGTVWMIVGGSVLFLLTALILVTKKRLYNEEG